MAVERDFIETLCTTPKMLCTPYKPLFCILQRNTMQAVILTDTIDTYVIYNYYNLTWVGGASQGCDPTTGRGSGCYAAWVIISIHTLLC